LIEYNKLPNCAYIHPGVSQDLLLTAEKNLGIKFPTFYSDFLMFTNGLEVKSQSRVVLYSLDGIVELNEVNEIDIYLPGYVLIGDEGGDDGYFLKLQSSENTVYSVGFGNLDVNDLVVVSESFDNWANLGFPIQEDASEPIFLDIYLEPKNKLTKPELSIIKANLGIQIRPLDYLAILSGGPTRLFSSIPLWKGKKIRSELSQELLEFIYFTEVNEPSKILDLEHLS
jgi:hypothetical protein